MTAFFQFSWNHFVYLHSLDELKEHIQLTVQEITPEKLQNVFCNTKDKFEYSGVQMGHMLKNFQ